MDNPTLVDLLTHIISLILDADKFQGEINVYHNDIDEHVVENLNFHEATTLQLEGLQKKNENLRADIIVLCQAVAALGSTRGESSKVKILKPNAFGGATSAKELENFIWDMEQYFTVAKVLETNKLNITTMYLTGDAKLW
ncbi:hypothetical protein R3W88_012281 [Solanum pinnatisectum]|uniref:Gag-pol polyprotein n=1 Tax=Solanum pinnatisectum TaxID=50273 RepID=A0AAV9L9D5_9SOLN|nr:hypothetical protein R3W88_012281 [Solanum pinnatisectum]